MKILLWFISFLFLGACNSQGQNWHCVTEKEKGRMLRWTNDFVQFGQFVYFDKHINPDNYLWIKPDFSRINKGPYQDPLEWEKDIPKDKYKSRFPYNIKKSDQQVVLEYLISGQIYVLSETPLEETLLPASSETNPYKKLREDEISYFTEYTSFHIINIQEIHFDILNKTLTETTTYKFTPQTKWRQRKVLKDNTGQIYFEPEIHLTPKENGQFYHKIISSFKGFPKHIDKTSRCNKDNVIKSYFRYMGNSFFNILRH